MAQPARSPDLIRSRGGVEGEGSGKEAAHTLAASMLTLCGGRENRETGDKFSLCSPGLPLRKNTDLSILSTMKLALS